jgi:plastocyanin
MRLRLLPCVLATAAAVNWDGDWEALHPSSGTTTATAAAGETVTFTWTDTHDVWLMADETHYNNCDWDGAKEIHSTSAAGKTGDVSGLGETKYYACHVGSHCESGQKIAITWAGTATPAPTSVTPAPSAACPESHAGHDHSGHSMEYAGACQYNKNYPLYATEAAANAVAEGDGTSHQMGGYWMPNCLEHFYHGDYSGDAPTCGAAESDAASTLGVGALAALAAALV